MNRKRLLLWLLLLSSCGNSKNVIVWSGTEILGIVVVCVILLVLGVLCLFEWLKNSVDRRDRSE